MTESRSGRQSMALWAVNGLMAGIMAILAFVIAIFGQDVEAALWPIVHETEPTDHIFRNARKACFALHLTKDHDAAPVNYRAYAEAHLSPPLPLSLFLSDDRHRKYAQDTVNHKVGERWIRIWCFEMPATIADNQAMTITMHAEHERHHGWNSVSNFKPFKICGLYPDDPPIDVKPAPDPECDAQRLGFEQLKASP